MSDTSAIEWTDATWNPTTGCTKISPGCAHCYIERTPAFRISGRRFVGGEIPVRLHHDRLDQPRHWRKPRRVFVNSLSDLFHPDVPFDFVDAVMVEIAHAVHCDFQILTKRADRMRAYFSDPKLRDRIDRAGLIRNPVIGGRGKIPPTLVRSWPFGNLWLGVSVENRKFRDRIIALNDTPAAVRFVSLEPLLEDLELNAAWVFYLDWLIVGGESGPGARVCDLAWIRKIVALGKGTGKPVFVKQLGARAIEEFAPQCDHFLSLRNRKGGDPGEWPIDLRVREFPRETSDTVGRVGLSEPVAP